MLSGIGFKNNPMGCLEKWGKLVMYWCLLKLDDGYTGVRDVIFLLLYVFELSVIQLKYKHTGTMIYI